jgi:carboxyl-terminal processing protease
MSRKFLPILFTMMGIGVFVTFKSSGLTEHEPKSKYEKILFNVGVVLKQGHYSPKKIDDAFSKEVFHKYLSDIDPDKTIFSQKDIDGFKKYETVIDDEIDGNAKLESFYAITSVYNTRVDELSKGYQKYLSSPLDYSKEESVVMDGDKRSYARNEAEKREFERLRVKYLVLSKYTDLLDEREKNGDKKDYVRKADSTLEREARQKVMKQLDRYYANLKVHNTQDDLFSDFVNAITSDMDPHTSYFMPIEKRSFDEQISGTFYGIGAQLKDDEGKIKIASIITGYPAWKSGNVKVDDEVMKIAEGKADPVDVTGYTVQDAVKLIRGSQKGSEVRLWLKRADGTIHIVSLLRDKISLEETFAKSAIINGDHKIGYIFLPEFYADFNDPTGRRCATDVAKEIEKLKAEHVEGIIMDLRNNGGGSLNDVVDMAGLFIEDGPICQVKGREEKTMILRDRDNNILYSGPLAVMVDELSASASEIFAAAIQDYKRGIIVGSPTYGKGTVQRTISLDPDYENSLFGKDKEGLGDVKLTFRKFYRINGGATQLRGVVPDVNIPDRLEYIKPLREKDNPSALSWDEISKADYKIWNAGYDMNKVIRYANNQLQNDSSFNLIKRDVQWLEKNVDKTYSLNLQKFRAEQKAIRDVFKEMEDVISPASKDIGKLTIKGNDSTVTFGHKTLTPKTLNVISLKEDEAKLKEDKDKERNKQWLNRVSDDIYISETVKIVYDMIGQEALAKAGK